MAHRYPNYDYRQPGFYFVTICVLFHRSRFGKVIDERMHLNPIGEITQAQWKMLPQRYPYIELHEHIIMPNHMHGIIEFRNIDVTHLKARVALGKIIRTFKAATTHAIRSLPDNPWFQWQELFYDQILRNELSLKNHREYILHNPANWRRDSLYRPY